MALRCGPPTLPKVLQPCTKRYQVHSQASHQAPWCGGGWCWRICEYPFAFRLTQQLFHEESFIERELVAFSGECFFQ